MLLYSATVLKVSKIKRRIHVFPHYQHVDFFNRTVDMGALMQLKSLEHTTGTETQNTTQQPQKD